MIKKYLLMAGANYYPGKADQDWLGFFDSDQEARDFLKGQLDPEDAWYYDWYAIIDLSIWEEHGEASREFGEFPPPSKRPFTPEALEVTE